VQHISVCFQWLQNSVGNSTRHTRDIVPPSDGHVAYDAVTKGAERYGEYSIGRAEFIGTLGVGRAEQRDDARRAYEEVIGQSEVQGISEVWAGVRNRWSQTFGVAPTSVALLSDSERPERKPQVSAIFALSVASSNG
jgi:hypothetical protein